MTLEEVVEAFAEGVEYVTREGWVDPGEITDVDLCIKYHHVVNAFNEFQRLASEFDTLMYDKAGPFND